MRAVIFVNGLVSDYAALARWVGHDDYLIGADGGTAHCLAIGLRPHVVVGDLDSVDPEALAALQAGGTAVERHMPGKDQTDLELAMERGVRDGADELLLLGALGGRLDQTLANLLILAQREWPVPVYIAEGDQLAQALRGGQTLALTGEVGSTVSLVPLSPEVTGITYEGLAYPLVDATLRLGSTRGISNVLAASPATIRMARGLALIVQGSV